jgi:hypothetical protein
MMKKGLLLFGVLFFLCSVVFVSAESWSFTEPFRNNFKSFSSSIDLSSGFVIDARFMPTTVTHGYIVYRENNFLLQVTATKKIQCGIIIDNSWVWLVISNADVQANRWYTVKCDYNNTVAKLYVNGVLVSTKKYSGSVTNNFKNIIIGNNMQLTRSFVGYISIVNVTSKIVEPPMIVGGYQEFADESNCHDKFCDGNWSTYEIKDMRYFINYTKPLNAVGAFWKFKGDITDDTRIRLPSSCFNYLSNKIMLQVDTHTGEAQTWYYCFNGTDSVFIPFWYVVNDDNYMVWEEGIEWVYGNPLYQEDADLSSCSDASCDGDWLSSEYSLQQISYLKNGHSGATWLLKDECGYFNVSIPASCFNYDSKYLNLSYLRGEGFGGLHLFCQDTPGSCSDFGCSWSNEIASRPNCGDLFEEGVLWNNNAVINHYTLSLCDDTNKCSNISIQSIKTLNTLFEQIKSLISSLAG